MFHPRSVSGHKKSTLHHSHQRWSQPGRFQYQQGLDGGAFLPREGPSANKVAETARAARRTDLFVRNNDVHAVHFQHADRSSVNSRGSSLANTTAESIAPFVAQTLVCGAGLLDGPGTGVV